MVDTISLNGTDYKVEDLNDSCKYVVTQLQIVQRELQEANLLVDRLKVTKQGFSDLLAEELNKEE